jgi:hypothetical protein
VVGVYDDGINVPSSHALFIAVCASEPDTLGELPESSDGDRFVPIAVVGEVPIIFINTDEILKFGTEDVNRFVCVNVDETIGFWDSTNPDPAQRVFGFAMRSHNRFDDFGQPLPFQGVCGLRVLVSHQVEIAAFRLECIAAITKIDNFKSTLHNVCVQIDEHDKIIKFHARKLESQSRMIEELRSKLDTGGASPLNSISSRGVVSEEDGFVDPNADTVDLSVSAVSRSSPAVILEEARSPSIDGDASEQPVQERAPLVFGIFINFIILLNFINSLIDCLINERSQRRAVL